MFVANIVKIKTIDKDVLDSDTDKLCTQVGITQKKRTENNAILQRIDTG